MRNDYLNSLPKCSLDPFLKTQHVEREQGPYVLFRGVLLDYHFTACASRWGLSPASLTLASYLE